LFIINKINKVVQQNHELSKFSLKANRGQFKKIIMRRMRENVGETTGK